MRFVAAEEMKPGMVIARSIYDDGFNLLLNSGISLSPGIIEKLQTMGLNGVYIRDGFIEKTEVGELLNDKIKAQALKAVKQSFQKAKIDSRVDLREVAKIVGIILDEVLSSSKTLVELIDVRSKNNYYFSHSISVCTLSILTGITLGYNQLNLYDLGKGAFLHDIGMENFVNPGFKGPLSSKEMLGHPAKGFEILRSIPEISTLSAHIAFQHHERCDGSGFPRGIKGDGIHPYAAIAAVADAYDTMVNPLDGKRLSPADALEKIILDCGRLYDSETTLAFIKHIAPYPIGSVIKLSTGELAVVIYNNKEFRTRPVVKVISDKFGKVLSQSFPEVDLSNQKDIEIARLIK
ncbi:MAG: HD domain-containing protein [Firmicutes bacterium]|nr:HD domain-containing protein [Bacillota bacterium]